MLFQQSQVGDVLEPPGRKPVSSLQQLTAAFTLGNGQTLRQRAPNAAPGPIQDIPQRELIRIEIAGHVGNKHLIASEHPERLNVELPILMDEARRLSLKQTPPFWREGTMVRRPQPQLPVAIHLLLDFLQELRVVF